MNRLLTVFFAIFAVCLAGKLGHKAFCGVENAQAVGPCIAGGCSAHLGYTCESTKSICCPAFDPFETSKWAGPSVGGRCPNGTTVVYGLPGEYSSIGTCIEISE